MALRYYLDLIIAVIITLASLLVSSRAFAKITAMEKPYLVLAKSIPSQGSTFYFTDSQRCFGTLRYYIEKTHEVRLVSLAARIRVSVNGAQYAPLLSVNAYFNPLGQLTDSKTTITEGDAKIEIVTAGITPIEASLSASPNPMGTQEFSIPGPLMLQTTSSENYALLYVPNTSRSLELFDRLPLPAVSSLGLTLQPESSDILPSGCAEDKQSFFDLSYVFSTIPILSSLDGRI